MVLPQMAKQAIGVPSSSLHPLHPPVIGMSLAEVAADIWTAMSDAWTTCAAPATTIVKARNKAIWRRTFSNMTLKIVPISDECYGYVRRCDN